MDDPTQIPMDLHAKNLRRVADAFEKLNALFIGSVGHSQAGEPEKARVKGPEMMEALHTLALSVDQLKAALTIVEGMQSARPILEAIIKGWS